MEHKLPQFTPVRHNKDGYDGWIDDITTNKDIFTGNKNCESQYRIIVGDINDRRRIAPLEDLEVITEGAAFPYFLNKCAVGSMYREETALHSLGYQITDKDYVERGNILINVAIPILGLEATITTILDLIYQTTQSRDRFIERRRHALTEWRRDLDMLLDRFSDAPELKQAYLVKYIKRTKKILDAYGVEKKDNELISCRP